jgi:hypothetical protein
MGWDYFPLPNNSKSSVIASYRKKLKLIWKKRERSGGRNCWQLEKNITSDAHLWNSE